MITRNYKKRTGWGQWSTIEVYKCVNGHENHMRKNWSGSRPRGAFLCSTCQVQIRI